MALPELRAEVAARCDSGGVDFSVRWYAEDALAGFASFRIWRTQPDEIDFHALQFEPAFQGHGFYTRLRRQLAAWGATTGVVRARITSGGRARATFLRTGFRANAGSTLLTGTAADLAQ